MQRDWKKPTEEELLEFRSKPFLYMPSAEEEDICYQSVYQVLSKLKEDGFGGIIFFNMPTAKNKKGFTPEEYLGERYMQLVKDCAKICTELGLSMWIHDGYNCPPGTAGGRISPTAYPELTPLRLRLDGENSFIVEEVSWGFPGFEYPKSAELHQHFTYKAYKKAVGEYFGNTIKGFFSDADNRRVDDDVHEPNSLKKDYFPWSTNFEQTFFEEYGYDIKPYIPSILKRELSEQANDYWTHAGNLYQGWFKSNHKWCQENGLLYAYHTSDAIPLTLEQSQRSPIYTEGKSINVCAHADYCGTDQMGHRLNGGSLRRSEFYSIKKFWGSEHPNIKDPNFYKSSRIDLRTKQAQSTAYLKNRKGVFCEMYAAVYWWATPQELLEIASWEIINGATFLCHQAYHYRLLDHLKSFAPPDFSHHSLLTHSNKQMNDLTSRYVYYATRGKLQAPIAVLDISDDILDGLKDTDPYLDLCDELGRLPYGYVIADEKSILENKDRFSVVVYAGLEPHGKRKEMLDKSGLPVISFAELDRIKEFVSCDISYKGYGKPHFMRRILDGGEQLIALANLYDGTHMNGELTFGDKVFKVSLASGEIGFFTKNGQIEIEKRPTLSDYLFSVDTTASVKFDKQNLIPLEYWKTCDGETTVKTKEDKEIHFTFTTKEDGTGNYSLFIPNSINQTNHKVYFDNQLLTNGKPSKFYDDKGVEYGLNRASSVGEYTITIIKDCGFMSFENAYLKGDFDVELKIEGESGLHVTTNGVRRNIPLKASVSLTKRTKTLQMDKSWCLQGQPFYSGGVTYEFEAELPKGKKVLDFGVVRDVCEVKVNGKNLGKRIRAPYTYSLDGFCGKVKFEVKVYNLNVNELDNFLIPSGLISGVKIYK